MGQYVNRTDPKTGKDRKYYKADDGKLYNDYSAAASANMNPIARVQRWAGDLINGRSSSQPSATTDRQQKIKNVMGVSANIIDPNKDSSLVRTVAPLLSSEWGRASYANPVNNTIAINGYQPGAEPYLEAHEAGHLSYEEAGPAKFLGVSGRAVTGLSDRLNNPAPLELLGGFLTKTFDASEEDRAERLSAKYGPRLGGNPADAPTIDSQGRSRYGNRLRDEGNLRIAGALAPVTSLYNSAQDFVVGNQQSNQRSQLEPKIKNLTGQYRQMLANDTDTNSAQFQQINRQLRDLQTQYSKQGGNFDQFVSGL